MALSLSLSQLFRVESQLLAYSSQGGLPYPGAKPKPMFKGCVGRFAQGS